MRLIEAFGRAQTLLEWSRETGVSRANLETRLRKMPPEEALSYRRKAERNELWEGANDLPWCMDEVAQELTRLHGPFTLEELGVFFGIGKERVRQIEAVALGKFVAAAEREGILDELRVYLEERIQSADDRSPCGEIEES